MKYNYKIASELFDRLKEYYDPWTTTKKEIQEERRLFMRMITRREDMTSYINWLEREIEEVYTPCENEKSRCWDFDGIRKTRTLIEDIKAAVKPLTPAEIEYNNLNYIQKEIDNTMDRFFSDDIEEDLSDDFIFSYKGKKANIFLCPESLEIIETMIGNLCEVLEDSYI